MALALDAFKILSIVGAHPEAFPDVSAIATKAARDLVTKQLKSKTSELLSVRAVYKALGNEAFISIVDGMTDSELKTLVTKLDKHHPELKASNAHWRRTQLCALAAATSDRKYPPAEPGALGCEPLEAAGGVADAAPGSGAT